MKQILTRRRPSQLILSVFLALVISSAVTIVGKSAAASIVNNQDRLAIQLMGIVSDTMCGGTHGTKTQGDAECTRVCVKFGAQYALVAERKIYTLQGHQADLNAFAGDMVVLRGKIVNNNTIAVESVVPYTVWAATKLSL